MKWVAFHESIARPRVADFTYGFQILRVVANSQQVFLQLWVGRGNISFSSPNTGVSRNFTQAADLDESLNTEMGREICNFKY